MEEAPKMEYRKLGHTGLKVSLLSFGNMINYKPENVVLDDAIIKKCLDGGINFFDTAELYADGEAEKALGRGLLNSKVDRQDIVVSTKIWSIGKKNPNFVTNTNRKHVTESVDQCLKRLQMDYVDIIFAHSYDNKTPMEEICRSFDNVIEQGKAFYWGTSNWAAEQVFEAFEVCDRLGLHRPVAEQMQYNMFIRKPMEVEYETLFDRYHYGITAWSPLAGGFLTGKYLDKIPEGSRLSEDSYFGTDLLKKLFYDPYNNEKTVRNLKEVQLIAKELKCSLAQLALAWVMYNKDLSTAITGARSIEQITESLEAFEVYKRWTPELDQRINKIMDTTPVAKMDYSTFTPGKPRRP